ncbi:unnamed protein product [Nippostrongylus brasiliensis]|uniref:Uncharacterized protein n=1 Tax=Nippostrongylus brasiliensis TaxID=27835 RepID=A0A0N4YFW1_NIPBR|nr:unnamed protein product [Nippostrongylus brasiliensis]
MKNLRESSQEPVKPNSSEVSDAEDEIEFEIDESLVFAEPKRQIDWPPGSISTVKAESAEADEISSDDDEPSHEKKDVNQNRDTVGAQVVAPPLSPPSSKKSIKFEKKPIKLNVTQRELLAKVQALLLNARIEDEQRKEKGEEATAADELIKAMTKIHSEYSDLIEQANERSEEVFGSIKQRAKKATIAAMVPVVTAACQEVGVSVSYRYWMDSIYRKHVYQRRGLKVELGPLCWTFEAPKVEDNYRNVAPGTLKRLVDDSVLPFSSVVFSVCRRIGCDGPLRYLVTEITGGFEIYWCVALNNRNVSFHVIILCCYSFIVLRECELKSPFD